MIPTPVNYPLMIMLDKPHNLEAKRTKYFTTIKLYKMASIVNWDKCKSVHDPNVAINSLMAEIQKI